MKDYIVTVEETYFDATKFDFNKFYIVKFKEEEVRCLLAGVTQTEARFIYITKTGYARSLRVLVKEVANNEVTIKEVETLDEVVPLSKAKSEYKDLYYNDAEMKEGKCYEVKIGERVYKGFCSYRDSEDITMVIYSDTGTIGAITYDPSMFGKYNDNITIIRFPSEPEIIRNSLTSGVVVKIDRNELKEDRVYFKELV